MSTVTQDGLKLFSMLEEAIGCLASTGAHELVLFMDDPSQVEPISS
jgi:hypothetical protein